jgi:hypothetical protein
MGVADHSHGWLEPPPYHFTSLNSIQKISLENTEKGGGGELPNLMLLKYIKY